MGVILLQTQESIKNSDLYLERIFECYLSSQKRIWLKQKNVYEANSSFQGLIYCANGY